MYTEQSIFFPSAENFHLNIHCAEDIIFVGLLVYDYVFKKKSLFPCDLRRMAML